MTSLNLNFGQCKNKIAKRKFYGRSVNSIYKQLLQSAVNELKIFTKPSSGDNKKQ